MSRMKSCTINEGPLEKLVANCYTKPLSKIKVASGINVLVEKCPEADMYWREKSMFYLQSLFGSVLRKILFTSSLYLELNGNLSL